MEPMRGQVKEREYLNLHTAAVPAAQIVMKNEFFPINRLHNAVFHATPVEFDELYLAIEHPIIRPIVATMYYSGLRVGEALNLQLFDVDFSRELFHVKNTKGKVDRLVPINKKLIEILKDYQQ